MRTSSMIRTAPLGAALVFSVLGLSACTAKFGDPISDGTDGGLGDAAMMSCDGPCVSDCARGWADCDGKAENGCETNLMDAHSCGSCTTECQGDAPVCTFDGWNGGCVAACPSSLPDRCDDGEGTVLCVDHQNDPYHCGNCYPCQYLAYGTTCVAGTCVPTCNPGFTDCDHFSYCNYYTDGDTNNCGACGHVCPSGQLCTAGVCTTSGALTWSSLSANTTRNLNAVWGSGANDVYAVGRGGTIVHSSDGGMTWSVKTDVGVTGFQDLSGVWGSSASDVYIVGDSGTILHSTNGGAAWVKDANVPSLYPDVSFRGIWGSGPNDIYVVAGSADSFTDSPTLILHSADAGHTWNKQDNPASHGLRAIWGSGPSDVYAVGPGNVAGVTQYELTILHSTGNGVWTQRQSQTICELNAIWGSGPGDVYAAGDDCMMHSTDGVMWAEQPAPGRIQAIWGPSVGEVYAAGQDHAMFTVGAIRYRTTNSGKGWGELQHITDETILGIWGTSATNVYMVGTNGLLLHATP